MLNCYIFDEKKHYAIDELRELIGYAESTRATAIKDKLIGSGILNLSDVIRRRCKLRGLSKMGYHYFIEEKNAVRLLKTLGLTQEDIRNALPDYAEPKKPLRRPRRRFLKKPYQIMPSQKKPLRRPRRRF